jgi:ribonuclease E
MTKRMLIDATHAEETRVVVLDGNRLEDFDVETSTKRQLKGNIYLAKVVRVEPSLQAAFVEYGGNRHGFLAFGEIHPDYYQIPVADRQRLIDMQAEDARREEEEEDRAAEAADAGAQQPAEEAAPHAVEAEPAGSDEQPDDPADHIAAQPAAIDHETVAAPLEALATAEPDAAAEPHPVMVAEAGFTPVEPEAAAPPEHDQEPRGAEAEPAPIEAAVEVVEAGYPVEADAESAVEAAADADEDTGYHAEPIPEQPPPETVGGEGDGSEDRSERRIPPRFLRNYKIRRSSSGGRSCWCRWSRKNAARRARR